MCLQQNLEFQLRLQQYIELRREGKSVEAVQHIQKYLAPHKDIHETEVFRAMGMLAIPPDVQAEPYKVCLEFLLHPRASSDVEVGYVLPNAMGRPRGLVRQNPPRALLPSPPTPPPHRPQCRTLRFENPGVPLRLCKLQLQRQFQHNLCLPDLQPRTQRAIEEPAVRASYEKLC